MAVGMLERLAALVSCVAGAVAIIIRFPERAAATYGISRLAATVGESWSWHILTSFQHHNDYYRIALHSETTTNGSTSLLCREY
jgi:hypothetical protein